MKLSKYIIIGIIGLSLLLPSGVFAMPVVDSVSQVADSLYPPARSSISWTHTVGANAKVLIIGLGQSGGSSASSCDRVSGVTVNSSSTTRIRTDATADCSSSNSRTYLYQLLNPPTGSVTITVSMSTADYITGGAISFSNTTSSPIGANAGSGTSATSITTNITTTKNDSIIVDAYVEPLGGGANSPGSGQEWVYNIYPGNDGPESKGSRKNVPIATTTSMFWGTTSVSQRLAQSVVEIIGLPDVVSASTPCRFKGHGICR